MGSIQDNLVRAALAAGQCHCPPDCPRTRVKGPDQLILLLVKVDGICLFRSLFLCVFVVYVVRTQLTQQTELTP